MITTRKSLPVPFLTNHTVHCLWHTNLGGRKSGTHTLHKEVGFLCNINHCAVVVQKWRAQLSQNISTLCENCIVGLEETVMHQIHAWAKAYGAFFLWLFCTDIKELFHWTRIGRDSHNSSVCLGLSFPKSYVAIEWFGLFFKVWSCGSRGLTPVRYVSATKLGRNARLNICCGRLF